MANLMTVPRLVAVDGDGNVMAGARLYFYTTGTLTPKDVYTDSGGGSPITQPVEADMDGLFQAIYLGTGDYKVILKTSADVTVWTTDPMSGTSAVDTLTTRGDLLTRNAAGYTRLAIGTSGYILRSDGVDPSWSRELTPYAMLQGLTYQNNVSDATNDLDIATGAAMDSSNAKLMVLGSALTKRSDANWAVGTNQGMLDTGAIGNNDYYLWLIFRSDTEVTDVLCSLSSTSPTMPASYSYKRLIGWFKRSGGAIVAFTTYESDGGALDFSWVTRANDIDRSGGTALSTTRVLDAVRVPLNISTIALLNVEASITNGTSISVGCPDEANAAVAFNTAPLGNVGSNIALDAGAQTVASGVYQQQLRIRTDTSGQIASRASASVTRYIVSTVGFHWSRR